MFPPFTISFRLFSNHIAIIMQNHSELNTEKSILAKFKLLYSCITQKSESVLERRNEELYYLTWNWHSKSFWDFKMFNFSHSFYFDQTSIFYCPQEGKTSAAVSFAILEVPAWCHPSLNALCIQHGPNTDLKHLLDYMKAINQFGKIPCKAIKKFCKKCWTQFIAFVHYS